MDLLIGRSLQAGIAVRPSTTVTAVDRTDTGYRVILEASGGPETIECDLIVHGAGREADGAGLDLDAADVDWGTPPTLPECH